MTNFFSISNIKYYVINNINYNFSTITIIIRNIGINKNFPLVTNFLWSYNCGDKLNSVILNGEYKDIKELSEDPAFNNSFSPVSKKTSKNFLSQEIVFDILKQSIIFLKFYSHFYFTHNELTSEFLCFSSTLTNFQYNNKNIESPIRIYILPSGFSSISIYNKEKNLWSRFSFFWLY